GTKVSHAPVAPTNKTKFYKNVSNKGINSVSNVVNATACGASASGNAGAPAIHAPVVPSNTNLNKNIRKKMKRIIQMLSVTWLMVQVHQGTQVHQLGMHLWHPNMEN
ncbi:unnamed protein product, partial [Meganyctiphanes norvegica]